MVVVEEVSIDSEEEEEEEDEVAKKAREEAEARRNRILQGADGRLAHLAGDRNRPKGLDEGEQEGSGGGDGGGGDTAEAGGETAEAAAPAAADEKPAKAKSSAAAKMAAARRRRFKKGGAKKDEDAGASESKVEETKPSEKKSVTDPDEPAVVTTPSKAVDVEPEPPKVEAEAAKPSSTQSKEGTEKEVGEEKKKYVGVAKMRRRMLKERHERQQDGTDDNYAAASSPDAASKTSPGVPKKHKKAVFQVIPVVMHLVTVGLLFFAGLDVGLQQRHEGIVETVVHTELAPRQLGFQILNFHKKSKVKEDLPSVEELLDAVVEENEFGEAIDANDGGDDENLDPLFGIDLDKLTRGPGLYFWLARGAVSLHRLNLAVFYYLPLRLYNNLASTFSQFVQTPPMLCLIALVVRQVVAKIVLGAKLPDAAVDETQQKQDILGMAKQFVIGLFSKTFPTAVGLYDAWKHLRADMYVITCGLMVGLAIAHSSISTSYDSVAEESTTVYEEEPPAVEDTVITDEL